MATITLEDVTKAYGGVEAVRDATLTVGGGQFHALVGPNGSGKTTVLRLLLGLTRPDSGAVGRDDAVLGSGFQTPNFYRGLTVAENLDVFASLVGAPDGDWRETIVDELRLRREMDRRAADLSGGFARKLDLALALLKQPDVLLLDEPLGALDDVSKARLLAFLEDYRSTGATVLVSTHHLREFEPHVDRVTMMHAGEILLDSPREAIETRAEESLHEFYVRTVSEREGLGAADD